MGIGLRLTMVRYTFSGHETFTCKTLWLKKGYDFLKEGKTFNQSDAVLYLGVGKNMVSSIRFWMKAFGLTVEDKLTPMAHFLFSDDNGKDLYCEENYTLWLLHYLLVSRQVASIYSLTFMGLQRETKMFDKDQLLQYIKRKCSVPEQKNVFNENTVKKDIGVLLGNYVMPTSTKSLEEYNALLIELGLIRQSEKKYLFGQNLGSVIPEAIILFALLDYSQGEKTISYDRLQEVALFFCLSMPELIIILRNLAIKNPQNMIYTDNSGVKNVQFVGEDLDKWSVLEKMYSKQ